MRNIFLLLLFIGCSNSKVLYTHSDNMSRLVSKQLVIDRFGEPSSVSSEGEIDEYYYDFGSYNQTVNTYDAKISIVNNITDSELAKASGNRVSAYSLYNQPMRSTVRTEYKYIKFKMIKDSVISWESKGVNFETKKKKNQ